MTIVYKRLTLIPFKRVNTLIIMIFSKKYSKRSELYIIFNKYKSLANLYRVDSKYRYIYM